jgi:hypothetical protein
MACKRCSLTSNTLHQTTVTQEYVCIVVDQVKAGLVEFGGGMVLSNGKTDGVGETLAKRACSDFNTLSIVRFGVTRSDAVYRLKSLELEYAICGVISGSAYSEGLDIIHGDLVSSNVKERILKHASMSVTIFRQ